MTNITAQMRHRSCSFKVIKRWKDAGHFTSCSERGTVPAAMRHLAQASGSRLTCAAHEQPARTTGDCRRRQHRRSDRGARVVRLFEQVLVLERDEVADRPVIHKSVPQGNHLHALLHGGLQVLSLLYPAFTEDLTQRGATQIKVGRDIVWYLPDGKAYSFR